VELRAESDLPQHRDAVRERRNYDDFEQLRPGMLGRQEPHSNIERRDRDQVVKSHLGAVERIEARQAVVADLELITVVPGRKQRRDHEGETKEVDEGRGTRRGGPGALHPAQQDGGGGWNGIFIERWKKRHVHTRAGR